MPAIDAQTASLLKRMYASDNGYLDADGRYAHRVPDTFTPDERQALTAAGLEPNHFLALAHDEAVGRLRQAATQVDLRRAADVFVASMTSSSLAWLPVLPAMALGQAMPAHAAEPMKGGACRVCFHEDKAVDRTQRLWHRRMQGAGWGTNEGPMGGVLALEDALTQRADAWPTPTPRDVWVLHQVLDLLRGLPPATTYGKARDALKTAALLSTNDRYRCETLLEALAVLGVLETPEHPGLFTRWTNAVERDQRPNVRVEVPAPLAWWHASNGVNGALVERLFGHLKRPDKEPAKPTATKAPRKTAATRGPKTVPGPVSAGDVYTVRFREDRWGAVYCHQVKTTERGVVYGLVEYLDVLSPTSVTSEALAGVVFRNRADGRWQTWCSGLDKTTGVRRIAAGWAAPKHTQPAPSRIPGGGAKNLRYLAGSIFSELGRP